MLQPAELTEGARHGRHSINYRDPAAGFVCAILPMADRVHLVFERGVLYTDGSRVDDDVVQEFLDHAVQIGAGLRAC